MPHLQLTHETPTPHSAQDIAAVAQAAQERDGVAPLSEQVLLATTSDPGRATAHVLVRESSGSAGEGRLTAYGQIDLSAPLPRAAEIVVHPRYRRTGLGTVVLTALRGVLADGDDPRDEDSARVAVWSHGDLPEAQAFASARGLVRSRELHIMTLELEGRAPEYPPAPDGLLLDTFDADRDEDAWLELNAAAFADHPEQGRMTRGDLRARMAEPWFDATRLWLVRRSDEEAGQPLAFLWLKQQPQEDATELYVLGVHPRAQGRGLGRYLTDLALADTTGRGSARLLLYVDGQNTAAVQLYQRVGFAITHTEAQYTG